MAINSGTTRDASLSSLNFFKVFFLLGLALVFATGCQKKSGPAAATGGGGGGTTNDGEIEYEVSGTIADDEEPVDFVESIAAVEISGVNLSASTVKYEVSAFYLSPVGEKTLVYRGTFSGSRFSFKSKVPKHLIVVEAVRVSDGGKFAGLLPPPIRSLLAKLRMTRTSSIAAKMAGIIADKVASGNAVAQSALATNSISVADLLTAAQSVRRTVDEQQSKGSGSAIDLTALAIKIAEKSNERMIALAAEGQSTESVAAKISEKTYESVFGENAETIPPGVLAHRTNLDLGTSTAATKDVAYEAIKALGTDSAKIVDEAFRVEATIYREASSVTAAVSAESTVASQFSIRFDACQASISSCAAEAYTPPPVSSGGSSGGSTTSGSTPPVITINTQPSNQTAVDGAASFSVSASVTNGATLSYQWEKQESGLGSFVSISGATSATLNLSSLANAADNGDVYRVVVSSTGGATSVTSSSAVLTVAPIITAPGVPTSVAGTPGDGQVSLTWTSPPNDGGNPITDYVIQYSSNGETNWTTFDDGTSTNTSATVTGLTNGTSYIFKVAATNSAGTGSYSSNSSSVTPAASNNACSNSVSAQRPNDCYNEGVAPNYAQDLPIGTERKGPLDVIMTLQYANGTDGFKIWKEKNGTRILNATGIVATGWQKQLTRAGTSFSGDLVSSDIISQIAGRVCPPNVFLNHSDMTATGRCLYYDAGNLQQSLDRDHSTAGGTEGVDWLRQVDQAATGAGYLKSYFEGNIKTCSDKGMRLPVLYETTTSFIPNTALYFLPASDGIPLPSWAGADGVPSVGLGPTWTASANGDSVPYYYWVWGASSDYYDSHRTNYTIGYYANSNYVRCVLPSASQPVITINTHPSNQTANGGNASFSVTASVTEGATLSFQWQKQESGLTAFNDIAGETSNTLSLTNLTGAGDNGDIYRVIVSATGGANNVVSNSASLTVPPMGGSGAFTLTGAGIAEVNGCYVESGSFGGEAYYTNGNFTVFYQGHYAAPNWVLSQLNGRSPIFFNPDPMLYFPQGQLLNASTTWGTYSGVSPAPALTIGCQ